MKTSFLLKSSLLATTGVYILPQLLFAQTSTRPHIILIVSDQHRGDAMNCMGNTSVISPNMTLWQKTVHSLQTGYSSTPSSTPARSGLLTGLSPWHHGMLGYGRVASQYRYDMPRMLGELKLLQLW